ncbi:MAG: methyltransferase domain-containing protein [Anaerolineales bacterium]|jgi:ubiquinone/menaquinone biosynthesis C-methylase UbiE
MNHPPAICDYEGSTYQEDFWGRGGRKYEDSCEAAALRRLLPPKGGDLLLELGAGAGRNTPRYLGFERIVLLDYSRSQLLQARERLGVGPRYTYVAANIYHLPFVPAVFEVATMIRTLHHLVDPPAALRQVREVMGSGGIFVLEFANKRNLKAVARYLFRHQSWNPFSLEAVEFAPLNFDFHPAAVRRWLGESGFLLERQVTVSHFRQEWLKRRIPPHVLARLDGWAGFTGDLWQLTPSVFTRSRAVGGVERGASESLFRCPECGDPHLEQVKRGGEATALACRGCGRQYALREGIYDFREPVG